jgi:O-antigen/teichoic acid export membrane protein
MRELIFYSGLYGGTAALLKILGFVIFLWLARTLSVDDYASFGLLYALQQGLVTFTLAGIVEAVVGLLKEHRPAEQRARLFAAANTAFFLMALGAIAFAMLLWVMFFKNSEMTLLTYISVLGGGVLLALTSFQAQLVRLEEKHLSSLLFSFLPPLTGLVGGFVAFMIARTVQSFFVGTAMGVLISLLGLCISRVGLWRIVVRVSEARHILLRAVPFIAVAFLGWLSGYGNNYLIDLYFLRADVAKFTFALSLCSIMLLIAGALNQVWAPRFYRLIHELPFGQVERKNQQFYHVLGLVLGFVGGGVVVIFPFAMNMLGGNLVSYQSMNLELSLLFSAYVLLTPWWHCQNHFLSHSMGQSILKITLLTSFIGIVILLMLMLLLGPIGIYIGFLAQMLLRAMGIVLLARRKWPVEVSWDGIACGLLLILVGYVMSISGITPGVTVLSYLMIVVVLVGMFFRDDLNRLVAK